MLPTITMTDVWGVLADFWSNPAVLGLLLITLALSLVPRILRAFRSVMGRR